MNMNKKKLVTALSSAFAALAVAGNAAAAPVAEVESNHPLSSAQQLSITSADGVGVDANLGVLGTSTEDLDFYSFNAKEGDVVTLDIDGGWGGEGSIDTVIAVFDADTGRLLRMNDDAWPIDAGSGASLDSRVDNFAVPATGRYVVGVSSYPRYFRDGGVTYAGRAVSGDYDLVVTGVSPEEASSLSIVIDIKPGSGEYSPINPKSKGKVPVALITSGDFDATQVDPTSVTFGATGTEASATKCRTQDVDSDGNLDMLCHFNNQDAKFTYESLEGIVMGNLTEDAGGTAFEGRGLLKVVPALTK